MRPVRFPVLLALLVATIHPQASAQTADATTAFAQRFLRAMSLRDAETLAAMMHFPASVRTGGVTLPVTNLAALAKAYDTIFTPELGCAVERDLAAAGGRTRAGSAGGGGDAVSIGHGAVHLRPEGTSFLITRIDEPAGARPAAPRAQPRTAAVPSGEVQFAGTLAAGGADRYVVPARQGDVLRARIERFQGRAIGVRILDAKTGRVVGSGGEAARITSATAAAAGDLVVEVTRLTFCEPAVSYLLTIGKQR